MMVLMMLPSLSPVLWRYHRALGAAGVRRPGRQTIVFCIAYSSVWVAVSVLACAVQLTRWKAHHLAHCRGTFAPRETSTPCVVTACGDGARLGLHCTLSCAGHTATLLAIGAMDPRAMIAVTAAITVERVMPWGARIGRAIGGLAVCAGLLLLEHAAFARSVFSGG